MGLAMLPPDGLHAVADTNAALQLAASRQCGSVATPSLEVVEACRSCRCTGTTECTQSWQTYLITFRCKPCTQLAPLCRCTPSAELVEGEDLGCLSRGLVATHGLVV